MYGTLCWWPFARPPRSPSHEEASLGEEGILNLDVHELSLFSRRMRRQAMLGDVELVQPSLVLALAELPWRQLRPLSDDQSGPQLTFRVRTLVFSTIFLTPALDTAPELVGPALGLPSAPPRSRYTRTVVAPSPAWPFSCCPKLCSNACLCSSLTGSPATSCKLDIANINVCTHSSGCSTRRRWCQTSKACCPRFLFCCVPACYVRWPNVGETQH